MKTPNDAVPVSSRRAASSEALSLAAVTDVPSLCARVARLSTPGFSSHPRLVFALAAREVPAFLGSLRQIEEVRPTLTVPRCPSLPRHTGALWFAEGLVVDLVALPLEPTFAPLWSLALPGAVVLVSLRHDASAGLLQTCCADAEIPFVDARSLVAPLELSYPRCVAKLLAAAIQSASVA